MCCKYRAALWAGLLIATAGWSSIASPQIVAKDPAVEAMSNLPAWADKQFWSDELCFHEYRIQRSSLTGDHRLTAEGRQIATGSFDECNAKLTHLKRLRRLPPQRGKAVIVMHGLGRTGLAMNEISDYLAKHGGYVVFNLEYPSTRADIETHAISLNRVIQNLEGIEEINFVGHSMGNLVVRRYLAMQTDGAVGKTPDPRIKRFVMLGPPNQGAEVAELFAQLGLAKAVVGMPLSEMGPLRDSLPLRLATPHCEFGIIAGGKGDDRGFNPLLPGDDDLIVRVDETRLPGASDFVVLPVRHSFLSGNRTVQEYTLRFLQRGYFISAAQRSPLAKAAAAAPK